MPDFLIVGAARCGTSWLAKNLATHPDVFIPPYKEIHFFDRYYARGTDWYRTCFANRSERVLGEATPAYLYFERIPELVRLHLPDAKILVIVRNPVERAYSHHANLVAKARAANKEYIASFEANIEVDKRIINEGLYTERLKRYYKQFPAEKIKVILNDDVIVAPNGVLRDVYGFLGVDEAFNSVTIENRINSAGGKLHKSKMVFRLFKVCRRVGWKEVANWLEEKNRFQLPSMREETRSMLLERYYLKDIERLEELLDRDLDAWRR